MDSRLNADDQWFVSPLIDLKNFRDEALSTRDEAEASIGGEIINDDNLINVLTLKTGRPIEEVKQIYEDLRISNFVDNSNDIVKYYEDFKNNKEILTHSQLQAHKELLKLNEFTDSSRQRKSAYITSLKYDKYSSEQGSMSRKQVASDDDCADDIVLVVDALSPYNRILTPTELRTTRLLRPQSKFLIRGDLPLFELRKKLVCFCDVVIPLEDGKELEVPDFANSTAELFPSSFIFVHDTFYVDFSNKYSTDISEPIREYMSKKKIFEPVESADMSSIKIIDLKLRLGQPYVFQHSGTCEHLLIFHDLRLMHPTDPQNLKDYPLSIYEKSAEKKCESCHRNNARYVVEKNEYLPTTYAFFCEDCFADFNFSNKTKICSFRAWPYFELVRLKQGE